MKRLAFLLLALGCSIAPDALPPTGQIVLYFDTDAPVPPGDGKSLTRDDPAPLFDTLRVEVFEPGQSEPCGACTREFPIDAHKFATRSVSIGIPTKPGVSGYRVRASIFPQEWVFPCALIPDADKRGNAACASDPAARIPHPATVIARTIGLPPVGKEGVNELTMMLDTESVGVPQGSLDAPTEPTPGRPGVSQVGTWPGATRNGCASAPRDDEACVPSGAFWRGNARPAEWLHIPISPRLVVLAPFFMKKAEVTVRECRGVSGCASYASSNANVLGKYWCDYTPTPTSNDELPVNCLIVAPMKAYCESSGRELPSAAQLEYAGRGLVGSMYVWGNDDPTCEDAMWGRGSETDALTKGPCYALPRGPYRAGSGKRDRLVLPTGTIVDLAGNLQEWAQDATPPDCNCPWPAGVLRDPVCNDPGGTHYAATGGSWTYGSSALALGLPGCGQANFIASMNGFRCSRPGL